VRIGWYDHGLYHQSSAIPDLPDPDTVWGVYGDKAHLHSRVNVVGMEMWRVPLLHRLLDDGHELVWLTRRKVDPSPELDQDLARLAEMYPEHARYVREVDPCLNQDQFLVWAVRTCLNSHYFSDQTALFKDSDAPSTDMLRYWVREKVLGVPPEVDVFVCAVMRADEATAFEVSYFTGIYLERGTPIVLWDQDHQLSGTVSAFRRLGHEWPHPLVTVIGPYEEPTSYAKPVTIDYPYVDLFERDPLPVAEKQGAVYVGNDYGRREAMERLLLRLAPDVPVTVYGRYDAKDGPQWTARFPDVSWAGRVPSNQVPGLVAKGHFTVNVIKDDYVPIGLLTLRTFDANVYGTLQIGDRRVKRLARYVPDRYLVGNTAEAWELAKRVMGYDDDAYREELEAQRSLTRVNDLSAFCARFYEIIDQALEDRTPRRYVPLRQVAPPTQLAPGVWGKDGDKRYPARHMHAEVGGWSSEWKSQKEAARLITEE